MRYQKFTSLFKKQVFALSYERQLELALTISKKLFFDYNKFSEINKWGDPNLLMDAIRICENSQSNKTDAIQIEQMLPRIDSITPDMDDFGDELSSYALNAAATVYETLQFIVDKNPDHIYNIGTYLTDTIDFKIQEDRELNMQEIDEQPLMIETRNFLLQHTKKENNTDLSESKKNTQFSFRKLFGFKK